MHSKISVVIPIYNEEEIVLDSAEKIYGICKKTNIEFEIVFSENGSTDNTLDLINKFVSNKEFTNWRRKHPRGYSGKPPERTLVLANLFFSKK